MKTFFKLNKTGIYPGEDDWVVGITEEALVHVFYNGSRGALYKVAFVMFTYLGRKPSQSSQCFSR
jgi:hypothetical protein